MEDSVKNEVLELAKVIIDLKAEKKKYNKEINDQIKSNQNRLEKLLEE